jgi:SAM-dependent methyltransferase
VAKWLNKKAKEGRAQSPEEAALPAVQPPAEPVPAAVQASEPRPESSASPVEEHQVASAPEPAPAPPQSKPRLPRLYGELAGWWPVLSKPSDYAEEAGFYSRLIEVSCASAPSALLELGSGGGSNASHMKARFKLTLVDLSPEMLAVSSKLNPECEHVQGDMREIRLDRQFDSVFVHDAVSYITSQIDLAKVAATAFIHCRPGGCAIFCPDFTRETFRQAVSTGGNDSDGRSLRYLEWTRDPDPEDSTYQVEFAYMMLDADGTLRVEPDSHIMGLFSKDEWLLTLGGAGFEAFVVPFPHADNGSGECGVFVGVRPLPPPPTPEPGPPAPETVQPEAEPEAQQDPFSVLSQPPAVDWGGGS